MVKNKNISSFLGKTFTDIIKTDDTITFITNEDTYVMYHEQDCCESVIIEDISGDLNDLIGTPITLAKESVSEDKIDDYDNFDEQSKTWTFYKLATVNGYVDIRWYGSSNGYYSEEVSIKLIDDVRSWDK